MEPSNQEAYTSEQENEYLNKIMKDANYSTNGTLTNGIEKSHYKINLSADLINLGIQLNHYYFKKKQNPLEVNKSLEERKIINWLPQD